MIANNTGIASFGTANLTSSLAPSIVVNRSGGYRRPIAAMLQAIVQGDATPSSNGFAISNTLVLHVP